ncbi:hypothetical protein MQA16_24855, partial [Escherichia coli]|nr:hypothetical protein [Escherichia coli]
EKRVFLVILFTSFSGSLVSRISGAVHTGSEKPKKLTWSGAKIGLFANSVISAVVLDTLAL